MPSYRYFWWLCLAFSTFPVFGQEFKPPSPSSVLQYGRNIALILCSPEFDGRGYVNDGCSKAAKFIQEEFQRLGLSPFNGKRAQPFYLNVNTFPNKCIVRTKGKRIEPGIDYLVHPSSGDYRGILSLKKMSAAEIMQYRFGDSRSSKEAIAFVAEQELSKDSLRMVRVKLEKIAQTDCAVIEFTREKLTWSISDQAFNFPYLQWRDTVQQKFPKRIRCTLDAELKNQIEVANCLGFIPSINPSDSLIVISAHYDHLGRMGKKTYFPGANDNASGVAMLLSLAREIMQKPLQHHSLLFVAFAGEEIGLKGSFNLVESGLLDLDKISLVLNLDILGSGEEGITVVNGSVFPEHYRRLVQLNESIPAVPLIKARGKAANSDHYPFSEKGVPALFIYTMGPNKHYHDVFDRYENLSFDRFEALHYLFLRFLNRF